MEIYIDDMLVKISKESNHIQGLKEAFNALWCHQMKLNLSKCTFNVTIGKFLGFLVTKRDIEINPEKIQAILDMRHLTSKKEILWLTGLLPSLVDSSQS